VFELLEKFSYVQMLFNPSWRPHIPDHIISKLKILVFSILCKSFIFFVQVIYPQWKCEEEFLLLIACLVAVLGEMVAQAVEAFYVSFVNVCMSLYSEVIMFELVVHLWIILSSCFCIIVSRKVNVAVVCYGLTCYLIYLHFVITLTKIIYISMNSFVPL
jgi:hypothetical protein